MYKTFTFILSLIWNNSPKKRYSLALINSVLIGFTLFFTPYFLWQFISNLSNTEIALNFFILFLFIGFIRLVNNFVYRRFFEKIAWLVPLNFLMSSFEKIYSQNYSWHLNNSTWYIVSVVKKISSDLQSFVDQILQRYISHLTLIILFFIYSSTVSLYLLAYFVLFTSFILLVARITYIKRIKILYNISKKWSLFDKIFIDFLFNIKTLKRLFIKNYAYKNIVSKKNSYYNEKVKIYSYNSYQWLFVDFMVYIMFALPMWYYFHNSIVGGWEWLAVVITIYWTMWIFTAFISKFLNLMRQIVSSKSNMDLLSEKINVLKTESDEWKILPSKWNKISFENTFYKYTKNKKAFISEIKNLEIKNWDKIAITWKSWSWKSTFLNLLTKNIFPNSWKIFLDDKNFLDVSEKFFEKNLIYISQDIELFDLSLKDNILLWKKVSEKEILRILKWLCLDELLNRLNWDLNVMIWEKWIKVSAGERQRINIARWLFLKRPIMILDEITANLDKKTTKKIWQFIFDECKLFTIIAVSHEDELLNFTNTNIVFENWKIIKK